MTMLSKFVVRARQGSMATLLALVLATCVAVGAYADSIGPIPGDLPQSRCASFFLSRHIAQRGQTIVATVVPHPESCKAETTGWQFESINGANIVQGCGKNDTSCTYKVTGPATGIPGQRVETVCINGTSGQGNWYSCDYYAVLPDCKGNPTFKVTHRRVRGITDVRFVGKNWDSKDCGPVTVTITGDNGAIVKETYDRSSFSGRLSGRGRLCGIKLRATQPTGRVRTGGFTRRGLADVIVLIAKPGTTPSGEQLFPGDRLCKDEVSFDPAQMTQADVRSLAAQFGQQLFEVESRSAAWTVDTSGQVAIRGVSLESADPELLLRFKESILHHDGVQNLPPEGSGPLSGFSQCGSSLTWTGDLSLDGGVIFVNGDLHVTGAVTGVGAVFATGSITANGGARFESDATYGLVAGGALNLP